MLRIFLPVVAIGALVLAGIAFLSVYTVDQTKQAIVLQFGAPVRVVTEPGLNFLVPFMQNVVLLEKRVLDVTVPNAELNPQDQKRVVVDAFVRWRISEPLRFFQTQGSEDRARITLTGRVQNSLQVIINKYPLNRLLSDQRDDIMLEIRNDVNAKLVGTDGQTLGIEIVDVRLRQVELPDQNREAVYNRMRAAREAEANQARAEGRQRALTITATADKDATRIRSEALANASEERGEGEAARACAFGFLEQREPGFKEFFSFVRTMRAYESALASDSTTMVLSPNSQFFQYFNSPRDAAPATTPPAGPIGSGLDRERLFAEVVQRCKLDLPESASPGAGDPAGLLPAPVLPDPAVPQPVPETPPVTP